MKGFLDAAFILFIVYFRNIMKGFLIALLIIFGLMALGMWNESTKDPYQEGTHFDYHIKCENGFVYKIQDRAAMQIFNSDGTPLRCGCKIY